jgi:hypothetical protein
VRSRPVVMLLRVIAVPLGLLWLVGMFALMRRVPGQAPSHQFLLLMPLSQGGGALVGFLLANGLGRNAGGWAAGSLFFPMICLPILAFLPYSDSAYWAHPLPASAPAEPSPPAQPPAAPRAAPQAEVSRPASAEPADLADEFHDRLMVRALELAQAGVPRSQIPERSVNQISEAMMKERGIAMPEMVRIVQRAFAKHGKL